MANDDKILGAFGEQLAKEHLVEKGYKLLETNFHTRYGEIDLIVQKENSLVFIEVKTRIGNRFGFPYEAIRWFKIKHLKKAVTYYLMLHNYPAMKYRMDAVSIILKQDKSVVKLQHFENIS